MADRAGPDAALSRPDAKVITDESKTTFDVKMTAELMLTVGAVTLPPNFVAPSPFVIRLLALIVLPNVFSPEAVKVTRPVAPESPTAPEIVIPPAVVRISLSNAPFNVPVTVTSDASERRNVASVKTTFPSKSWALFVIMSDMFKVVMPRTVSPPSSTLAL